MISFIRCIYNTVVKLLIYIYPHLAIVEDIISIIPEQIHVFIQYRSAQKHKTTTKYNHLSTLTFEIYHLSVT